jgi:hypothetical protein
MGPSVVQTLRGMQVESAAAPPRFTPGAPIAYRNRVRIDGTRREEISFAQALTVIHDTADGTALLHRPGEEHWARDAEHVEVSEFRHKPVVRHLDSWSRAMSWGQWRRIILRGPQVRSGFTHAISLFILDATDAVDFWYVDLVGPMTRRPWGFDFTEHGIDIVVAKDFSSWRWKDDDEFDYAVLRGSYTPAEAKALRQQGELAARNLIANRRSYESWIEWRPESSWPLAQLPVGWHGA